MPQRRNTKLQQKQTTSAVVLITKPKQPPHSPTMASRDLTATFIERRTATNRRRRSEGGAGSNVAPFGALFEKDLLYLDI